MRKERLVGFSDGYLAIVITLMVLEMKIPIGGTLDDLKHLLPVFMIYVISFLVIAIHWANHHHLFQVAKKVNDKILWANFNFLFWLSLIPFSTAWFGEHRFSMKTPVVFYALIMFIVGIAYKILIKTVIMSEGKDSVLAQVFRIDLKGWLTSFFNLVAVIMAYFFPLPAFILLVIVKLSWFIPDKRMTKIYYAIENQENQ